MLPALALLSLGRPALCQTLNLLDMSALLRGDQTPLTHKVSDLDGTWRRLTLDASANGGNASTAYLSLFSGLGAAGADVYYTQGRTEAFGGETYLVAYHRQAKPIDFAALMRAGSSQNQPKPDPLTPDTVLSLSLLNLRTAGSLNDIRAFDVQQEVTAAQQAAAQDSARQSESNLKQLSLGLVQYTQDYDESLPPMKDAATLKKALYPYIKSDPVFLQPDTKRPYRPNASLSNRSFVIFDNPATLVTMFEDAPDQDGTRAVAFLDGHVKRIPETQWPALKAASHVPGP